jgi:hypothetical protein
MSAPFNRGSIWRERSIVTLAYTGSTQRIWPKSPHQRAIDRHGRAILALPEGSTESRTKRQVAILVVGDKEGVRALRRDLLSEVGFDVMEVSAGKRVIRRILPNVGNVGQLPRSGTALRR